MTHVVRGDDHISNTPKQILLYQAMGAPLPQFAHVPLILGPDKKRLSKRHGATSVMEYARQGYLPRGDGQLSGAARLVAGKRQRRSVLARRARAASSTSSGISGGNAVFNPEKLDWFNQQHIARLAPEELTRRIRPSLEAAGLWDDEFLRSRHAWFFTVLELLKPRARRLDDFATQGAFLFGDDIEYDAAAVEKHLEVEGMAAHLAGARCRVRGARRLRCRVHGRRRCAGVAEARGVKAGDADSRGSRGRDRARRSARGCSRSWRSSAGARVHRRLAAARRLI